MTASIESKATRLLQQCGALQAPVAMDKVIHHLGLVAQPQSLAEVSGLLVVEDGRGVIGYNSAHSAVRQRFTIAHEIGHYVLHAQGSRQKLFVDKSVYKRDDDSSKGEDPEEVEANQFAAALLMPAALVRTELARLQLDLEDEDAVGTLAKRFNVSTTAMLYRLQNVGLIRRP